MWAQVEKKAQKLEKALLQWAANPSQALIEECVKAGAALDDLDEVFETVNENTAEKFKNLAR